MLSFLRDRFHAARLQARYQRLVQERLLQLVEHAGPRPVAPDPGDWLPLGEPKGADAHARRDIRSRARKLVAENPHARNMIRLLEIYVVGPGLALEPSPVDARQPRAELLRAACRLWKQFLAANRRHFSYREHARRTWRDGECFLRTFPTPLSPLGRQDQGEGVFRPLSPLRGAGTEEGGREWPPTVRFVDPEAIGPTADHPDSHGILTEADDVETPVTYLRIDPASGELLEEVPATEMFHTRIGADSNEKRGTSLLAPVLDVLGCFDRWRETELIARKLQASIVLWRKVQGGPSQVAALADAQAGDFDPHGRRRERYGAGTILTTSPGTELQFLQPDTNFGDAVPLGRLLLLCAAAGSGLPEFMLTSDASNANFASTMIAEGPAVKLFQSEQHFFAVEFEAIWRWAMGEAIAAGLLPGDFFEHVAPHWTFPQLVNRDRPKERLADARLVEAKILSRAEAARRDDADPAVMRSEIAEEVDSPAVS
ncbi:MAG: phage portal protein [Planctomycetales bacterium]